MIYTAEELFMLLLPEGVSVSDEKADALLFRAENTILDITGRTEIPERLIDVQAELALIFYNRKGTEGEVRRSEGELTAEFAKGIPEEIMIRLRKYPAKVGVLNAAD